MIWKLDSKTIGEYDLPDLALRPKYLLFVAGFIVAFGLGIAVGLYVAQWRYQNHKDALAGKLGNEAYCEAVCKELGEDLETTSAACIDACLKIVERDGLPQE